MKNVVCLKHRTYDGSSTPDLSCKTCCTKYVAHIKAGVAKKTTLHDDKIADGSTLGWQSQKAAVQEATTQRLAINPSFI